MDVSAAKPELRSRRTARPGFTLIELMVSIGLVVVLLLGINYVFKMSSDSIGMGQRVSEEIRDARAVGGILQDDARHWVKDAPIFIIRNEIDATNHRRDFMAFPARGSFKQAGYSSAEAFIWIGHRWTLPNATDPRYVVCRVPMLLIDDPSVQTAPLSFLCYSGLHGPAGKDPAQIGLPYRDPRYSIANTSVARLRQHILDLREYLGGDVNGAIKNWWPSMVYRYDCSMTVPRKFTSDDLAAASPAFIENVSQLRIEFTGDFVTQGNDITKTDYGKVTSTKPDGIPDFGLVTLGNNNVVRQTRWYGMRRPWDNNYSRPIDVNRDVLPVSEFIRLSSNPPLSYYPPFERVVDDNNSGVGYTCVWANGSPTAVRVMMKVEDPSGRIMDGPWHEFILGPQ